jgi:RNA polymerase sigma-70 factor, ECF subfamily
VFPLSRRRRRPDPPLLDRQLTHLIDEHASAVYHVAYGVLRDPGLAEDVVQDTMIKAWRSLGQFRGDSSTRTWVLRIAHNTAIDALRRRRERSTAPHDLPDGDGSTLDDPARRAEGRADVELLRRALAGIDELSRTIVVLREVEGLSYQEIADTLEIPIATVKTRLLRARRALDAAVRNEEDL